MSPTHPQRFIGRREVLSPLVTALDGAQHDVGIAPQFAMASVRRQVKGGGAVLGDRRRFRRYAARS
jgi:hypothetical protein